jgi:hypothetical protein
MAPLNARGELSATRREFVRKLYAEGEKRNVEKLAEQRANDQQRMIAAPRIRAVADRVVARELAPEEIRQEAERLARESPITASWA